MSPPGFVSLCFHLDYKTTTPPSLALYPHSTETSPSPLHIHGALHLPPCLSLSPKKGAPSTPLSSSPSEACYQRRVPSARCCRAGMTKKSVVVPEVVTVAVPPAPSSTSSPIFPYSPGEEAPFPLGKKFLKQLESGNTGAPTAVVGAWVKALRASSPPHLRPQRPLAPVAQRTWTEDHPSALGMFEGIANLCRGKRIVMFLDYDGTLSPIVDDPERAFMSDAMRAAVQDLSRFFPTVIVTGRCRQKVHSFVRLTDLYYAGSHGMDIRGPKFNRDNKSVHFQPASEFLPTMDEVYKALKEKTRLIPGSKVENNKFCVSVHFRCVDEKRWVGLAAQVQAVLKGYPKLRVTHGRKVLEIRPSINWDKGKALEFLLESLGFADCEDVLPMYIGDDQTDEDAFKVLRERGRGLGILVSNVPKDTHASYTLLEPSEVMEFLQRLVEWKRHAMKPRPKV